jgi:teichuronic acid biosynthesis glycosyltransferase TuaG
MTQSSRCAQTQPKRACSITVLVPAYNAERHILDALESVLEQVRPPDQIVVVDDGSTDRTNEVVSDWAALSPVPVEIIRQENRGAAAARNTGLRSISTDLIAFVDADDVVEPNHLAELEHAFHVHPDLSFAFGISRLIGMDGEERARFPGTRLQEVEILSDKDGVRLLGRLFQALVRGSFVPVSATVASRSALFEVGFFDESLRFGEDQHLYLRLSRMGPVAHVPKVLAQTRRHANNTTHPRFAYRINLGHFRVLTKMLSEAEELRLTREELDATKRAFGPVAAGLLYASSRQGVAIYARAWLQILRWYPHRELFSPRNALRAAIYSVPTIAKRLEAVA